MEEGINRLAAALDKTGMIDFTRFFVDDYRNGYNSVNEELLPWITELDYGWEGVLFVGMGGSGAGGDFISTLCDSEGGVPVKCHRNYGLPNWWNQNWLVVATSYSGNTEETVATTEQAIRLGGTVVVISSGGILSGLCELSNTAHLISCPGGQPPRSAFGHLFSRQLALMNQLGILQTELSIDAIERLKQAAKDCDITQHPEGDVASLALNLLENPIAIIGPSELLPALSRFKNQLNENAARFARIGEVPEMNHNELIAWGGVGNYQDFDAPNQGILIVTWPGMNERVVHRMDWFVANCPSELAWKIQGEGESLLECLLHICIMMDWLSIAVALLSGKDPTAIDPIDSLKEYLSQID